jgi:endonuclease YncB( thermonuclease family)
MGVSVLVSVLAGAGATQAASTHQHIWESGKVTKLADGDTVYVKVGSRTYSVRDLGIQATETSHAGVGTNECGSQAAKRYLTKLTLHKHVQLASEYKSSESFGRLLRSVYVGTSTDLSRDLDVQADEMDHGYTLWHPDPKDSEHNAYYHQLQDLAQSRHKVLWDPTFCGIGTNQDIAFTTWINWDAVGNDAKNPNGEWVAIKNDSSQSADISGWDVRDSSHEGDPAYVFPSGTVIPPHHILRLHSGEGTNNFQTLDFYNWGASINRWTNNFANGMGDGAYLQDNKGNIRSSATYPCVKTAVTSCQDTSTADALNWGAVSWNPPGDETHHPNEEYVSVRNVSSHRLDLTGHVFVNGGWIYPVPRGTYLKPGDTFRLYVGKGTNSRLKQYWGSPVSLFANAGDEVKLLRWDGVQTMCVDWGNVHGTNCKRI